MWYKVKELHLKGLNKSQIAFEVGIHRRTVRKYLAMCEQEFHTWLESRKNWPRKLLAYHDYVHAMLKAYPFLSAAQVEDRLKEEFSDFPMVHSKTVYNFTESIRTQYGIKKKAEKPPRQYQKLPEGEYGAYAQVDFGQYYMLIKGGSRKRVYFFVMVLCRSRQKFVYMQTMPFTTANTLLAHEKAFAYFEGQPRKIIYDQDRVLIVEENLGDVLLTSDFKAYCQQMDFEPVFCRKSDPESKGKVENVVKYVKNNFLSGRTYTGDEELNKTALSWLMRTGNGKQHAGTKKVPQQEWHIEREYLQALKPVTTNTEVNLTRYKVRKDNTIHYKSNFYTLPLGTYQSQDSWVFLNEKAGEIRLYDQNNSLLTTHALYIGQGQTIRNTDHERDKSQSIPLLKQEVLRLLSADEKGQLLIEQLSKAKPRYLRDSLLVLKKHLPDFDMSTIEKTVDFCLDQNVYNANRMVEIGKYHQQENSQTAKPIPAITHIEERVKREKIDIEPKRSIIDIYEKIL